MVSAPIFKISDEQEFNELALEIFQYQAQHCRPYSDFLGHLGRPRPTHYSEIPCLPISAFKTHTVYSASAEPEAIFQSSGTTGLMPSFHHVKDVAIYEQSFMSYFEKVYGPVENWCILALLPSYLERQGSSLITMVDTLIQKSGHPSSGFFLYEHKELASLLEHLKRKGQRTMLIGVSFALMDFCQAHPLDFPELIVMETGGMKGRKKELIREELHFVLSKGFGVRDVHSEYGMTELLSQAYSKESGRFSCPSWMRVFPREVNDPFHSPPVGHSGGLNIIDLANIHSCSFIASDDLGRLHSDGSFEVLGRFDSSDMRGCSLLV